MKRVYPYVVAALAALFLAGVSASAQRQTPGRPSVEVRGMVGWPTEKFGFTGGGVFFNTYSYVSDIAYGVDFSMLPLAYVYEEEAIYDSDGEIVSPYVRSEFTWRGMDVCASGGYYLRLLSNRSRSVILSGGAALQLGVRLCSEGAQYMTSTVGFTMNIVPGLCFEVFPFRMVSLFTDVHAYMNIVNTLPAKGSWIRPGFSFGVKWYL